MNQTAHTRDVMRGRVYHLAHNRRFEDQALKEANRLLRERARRASLPLLWRLQWAARDLWGRCLGRDEE